MTVIPRALSLVRFNPKNTDYIELEKYPFTKDKTYIFLGEIVNMPGHCTVAEVPTGMLISGYHIENFVELNAGDM